MRFDFGVDALDAFLILALDLHRDPARATCTMTFRAGSTWPAGVLSSTSPTDRDLRAVFLAQTHDDGIFVAFGAEHRRLRAGEVGANRVGDAGHREAEHGRLVAIDAHGNLRPSFFTTDARVGNAGRRVEQRLDVLRELLRDVELVAADFDGEPAAVATLDRRRACRAAAVRQTAARGR